MAQVPRERFVPREADALAYDDIPLPIGQGQTISAPSMVGIMCQLLDITDGCKVMEVGTGLGYHAAIMSILAGSGIVYTVERIPELAEEARKILHDLGYNNVKVFLSDGSEGLPDFSPYDRISVAASAPRIPEPLVNQLGDPGLMVLPVGQYMQELVLVEKKGGQVNTYNKGWVAFVPLLGRYGFKSL